jgi:PAS domain S-box-containing protein
LDSSERAQEKTGSRQWSGFLLRIVLPAILAVVLFIIVIFLILIPSAENQLLEGKKSTAQELTRAAISILDEYYGEETSGAMTREQAQQEAAARIENLRYGDEGKDYFWIQDTHPTMIMHPYVPELNGQDLTDYEDENGDKIFVEFVNAVEDDGSGWVDYYWQWQDDPTVIVPKISYVQLFEPWQWIVGTGMYVEDVNAAIADVERNLIYISLGIIVAVALLMFYAIRQSLKIERKRAIAEEALKESHEKYRALVEAATEGLLMTLGGKCAYSNEPLRDMLGYSAEELTDMDVTRLFFGETVEDREALANIEGLAKGEAPSETFEARLRHKDGRPVEVLITPTPISLAGREGFILIARSLSGQKAMEAALDDTRRQFGTMSDAIGLGVFRSAWGRRGTLLEANPAMRRILRLPLSVEFSSIDWLDHIVDAEQRETLIDRLNADKAIQDFPLGLRREDGGRAEVALYAVLVSGEDGQPLYCDGIVEDVTQKRKGVEEREALIAQLQT